MQITINMTFVEMEVGRYALRIAQEENTGPFVEVLAGAENRLYGACRELDRRVAEEFESEFASVPVEMELEEFGALRFALPSQTDLLKRLRALPSIAV
jgi:hypothetical protein